MATAGRIRRGRTGRASARGGRRARARRRVPPGRRASRAARVAARPAQRRSGRARAARSGSPRSPGGAGASGVTLAAGGETTDTGRVFDQRLGPHSALVAALGLIPGLLVVAIYLDGLFINPGVSHSRLATVA